MSPLRIFANRRTLWLISITLIIIAFGIALVWAWIAQAKQTITCNRGFGPLDKRNGYIEIKLKQQDPTEPTFDGELFFLSVNEAHKSISSVTVTRSADRGYAPLQTLVETFWDNWFGGLRPRVPVPFDVITLSRLHQYFPFDSATFAFVLTIAPRLDQKVFRLTNRVPGFVLPCEKLQISRDADGALHVAFALQRSPLIQLFVVILSVALVIFLVLIVRLKNREVLPTAVASYFFSAFSLRTIVSNQIKTFPTLFDCWILTVCMTMIVALLWTVIRRTSGSSVKK